MFDPGKVYPADNPQLNEIVAYSTLAHMRQERRGPAYFKLGKRILYKGEDLNRWLDSKRVDPAVQPAMAAQ